MAIDFSYTDRDTGRDVFLTICNMQHYRTYWRPAAQALGLELVALIGQLNVDVAYKPQLLAELEALGGWAEAHGTGDWNYVYMIESIDRLVSSLHAMAPDMEDICI